MSKMSKFVDDLGEELLHCNSNCEGVYKRLPEAPPRGLFLENPRNKDRLDCIIVGRNPGQASREEKEEYSRYKPLTYNVVKNYVQNNIIVGHKYYKRAKKFAANLGWKESILWTEICKCQSGGEKVNGKKKPIPLETFRTCIKNFLENELKEFPHSPIIALGNDAFVAVSYRFPNRFVIGIPHPSGNWSSKKFLNLFEKGDVNGKLKKEYKKKIEKAKEKGECVKIFPEG